MTDQPAITSDLAPESADGVTADADPTDLTKDEGPSAVALPPGGRFGSMRMPSLPFVVACLGVTLAVLVVLAAGHALIVFAIGIALSFFLVPVVDRLERRMPRIAACILVVAITVIVTLTALIFGATILIQQGQQFLDALPAMLASLQATYQSLDLPSWLTSAVTEIVDVIQDALANTSWGSIVVGFIQGFLGIVGILFAFMLLPFFTFYLLKDQPKMARNFYRQVPEPWHADIEFGVRTFIGDFAQYFKAELLVGAIMGVAVAVGMTVIGLIVGGSLASFALLLGLIAAVMELIPQIGPILSYIPALIIALTISPLAVVLVSVFYFIAFNIEGSILVPTFQGRMISFSGATVLLLITIGFALAGIIGAIVALPVASIIRDLFAYIFQKSQRESIVVDGVPVVARTDPGRVDVPVEVPGPASA